MLAHIYIYIYMFLLYMKISVFHVDCSVFNSTFTSIKVDQNWRCLTFEVVLVGAGKELPTIWSTRCMNFCCFNFQ